MVIDSPTFNHFEIVTVLKIGSVDGFPLPSPTPSNLPRASRVIVSGSPPRLSALCVIKKSASDGVGFSFIPVGNFMEFGTSLAFAPNSISFFSSLMSNYFLGFPPHPLRFLLFMVIVFIQRQIYEKYFDSTNKLLTFVSSRGLAPRTNI